MTDNHCKQTAEPSGVLLINKHAGVTSHDIVNRIRRLYGTRRVGHAGTLDPMATGVLVVLVGRAAKACEYLSSDRKQYLATLRLGLTTDSEDTTGQILTITKKLPTCEQVIEIIPEFLGKIQQIPPMYSALKVNGQKLLDLARRGKTVERAAREIEIFELTCTPTEQKSDYELLVTCSGGTYIRTLCADIGARLGCGGVMASLQRKQACGFDLANSYTLTQIEEMSEEERTSLLIPTESLFADLPEIRLPAFYERLIRSGCAVAQKKLRADVALGKRVRLADASGIFFALGEATETDEGLAVKSVKIFQLNE
jgi:tRNA pseudouridine55 synthase